MTKSEEQKNQLNQQEQEADKSSLNRREFLVAGAAAASALAFPGVAEAKGMGMGRGRGKGLGKKAKVIKAIKWNNPFFEPQIFRAGTKGRVGTDLSVQLGRLSVQIPQSGGGSQTVTQTVRTYNGSVPGPTFSLMPGDKLEMNVINNLPPNTPPPDDSSQTPVPTYYANMNCQDLSNRNIPGCFNTTNLHTHGLHVSPSTIPGEDGNKYDADSISSDDVHVRIPPATDPNGMDVGGWQSTRHYCVQLPEFHAPGTHWYHAHIHGATAIQVVNALAGALIVEEPADQKITNVDGTEIPEKILIMQEIIGADGTTPDTQIYGNFKDPTYPGNNVYQPYGGNPSAVDPDPNKINSAFGFTINTLSSPTIEIAVNEIQRWRCINATATPRGFMNLGIYEDNAGTTFLSGSKGTMNLIAEDGITFYGQSPQVVASPGHFMAPANRADFLVQFSQPGTYYLWKQGVQAGTGKGSIVTQPLASINVTESPVNPQPLPSLPGTDKRPCYLEPITDDEISNTQTFIYHVPPFSGNMGAFTINGKPYGDINGNTPNDDVTLGTAEEWTLENTSAALHPFHIHVNPFQVLEVKDGNGNITFSATPENARWWDSFAIPAAGTQNGQVKIRSRFLHYPGKFVQHCHILIHEDVGMMRDITVLPTEDNPGTGPCEPLADCVPITPV